MGETWKPAIIPATLAFLPLGIMISNMTFEESHHYGKVIPLLARSSVWKQNLRKYVKLIGTRFFEIVTELEIGEREDRRKREKDSPVPYRSKLTESFEPGQTLLVKGKTAEDSVSGLHRKKISADIALLAYMNYFIKQQMQMPPGTHILGRFTINLHNTSADFSGNDVPLHISVRFDEGKIEEVDRIIIIRENSSAFCEDYVLEIFHDIHYSKQ
ncbi:Galectin [Dirofilaria immitis]|nr:Galectin [Dirofilaria immitis]